jgi:hypothetical protein
VTIARPPGGFCHWKPLAGHELGHPCPVCGHSDLVHIGTEHCPVCELVYQATPAVPQAGGAETGRAADREALVMVRVGCDRRVGRYFWRAETAGHRWSVRLHAWLAPGNMIRLNHQPAFSEIMIGRCVVLCHSRLTRTPSHRTEP